MNTNRLWAIGSALVIVIMLAGTWFLGVSPQLAAATSAALETTNVKALNQGHEMTLKQLEEQYKDIGSLQDDLKDVRVEVPTDMALTPLFAELGTIASANGVVVTTITVSDPLPYVPTDGTDPEFVSAMGSVSGGNFYVVPVQMSVLGATLSVLQFVRDLQTGSRLFLAFDLSFDGTDDDPATDEVSLTITGQIFVLTGAGTTQGPPPTSDGAPS